jgi:type I restriction enzyme S subunit
MYVIDDDHEPIISLDDFMMAQELRKQRCELSNNKEQKRIVAKLDEIFAELDKIDEKQTRLATIQEKMEANLLKLAIQGKLVEQRFEEGSGEELLKLIQKEKQELIKQGKTKKEKPLPDIEEDEIPFDIPASWKWVRIGNIFNHSDGKSLNSSDTDGEKYTYITTSNAYWNKFVLNDLKTMYYKESELEKCSAKKGDLLVLEGGDIGRAAIWNYDYDMRIQNHIHRLRPLSGVEVKFYYYIFFLYKTSNLIDGRGIGLQGLSANKLKAISMPLPPAEEQKRIVAKIEELLPLCRGN